MCAALIVAKTPVEERLVEMLSPTVEGMGYDVVRLRLMGGRAPGRNDGSG